MTRVALVLQPGTPPTGSMALYARRLVEHAPEGEHWRLVHLPVPGGRRLAEVVVPPLVVPRLGEELVHVVDHAHAGYLRFARCPGVVTVHDLIPLRAALGHYPPEARARVSRRALLWLRWNLTALRRARRIVVPSRATATQLQAILDLVGEVVPHGVDRHFFTPALERLPRELAARLGDRRVLLQVSSGFFYKNDAAVSAVYTRLVTEAPDLVWVRVGRPRGSRPRHVAYVEVPALTPEALAALYARAAVLLFPSWDEGFGWPPLEAMAAGCPVVASATGALAETAAPAALVVEPADREAQWRAVRRVLTEPGLAAELRARGREHAARFAWTTAARRLAELYAEVSA